MQWRGPPRNAGYLGEWERWRQAAQERLDWPILVHLSRLRRKTGSEGRPMSSRDGLRHVRLDDGCSVWVEKYIREVPVRTKRWNDPVDPDDGTRLLICRYRPRGVKKEDEPWDAWCPALAPSRELHARAYGKNGDVPISFVEYERVFLGEMKPRGYWIGGYADAVRRGKTLTLLC